MQTSGPWPQIGICATPEDAYRYRPGTHLVAATQICTQLLSRRGRVAAYLPLPLPNMVSPLRATAPHLLVAAPLTRASSLDLLLKSIAAIPNLTITLAGEGNFRDDLADIAQRANLRVEFANQATPAHYQRATLIIHPQGADLEGSAIRAAYAAARPLIATATEAARELITPNETALMIPIADGAAFTHSIQLLINHPELAAALALGGHQRHRERFTQDLLNQRWQRYLAGIAAAPAKPAEREPFNVRRL